MNATYRRKSELHFDGVVRIVKRVFLGPPPHLVVLQVSDDAGHDGVVPHGHGDVGHCRKELRTVTPSPRAESQS